MAWEAQVDTHGASIEIRIYFGLCSGYHLKQTLAAVGSLHLVTTPTLERQEHL